LVFPPFRRTNGIAEASTLEMHPKTDRMKYAVLLLVAAFAAGVLIVRHTPTIQGQTRRGSPPRAGVGTPDTDVIDRFDRAIQQRFVTQPDFGIARVVEIRTPWPPGHLESRHVRTFSPVNDEERDLLAQFENEGWAAGIYLFGKRAEPRQKADSPMSKFDIRYRVNKPVPITQGLKDRNLPGSKKILREVKDAFLRFQSAAEPETEMRFEKGDWSFVARPVRAVDQSCVSCHADYVVTAQLPDGKFEFRRRKIGDVNGVIVYGFSKNNGND
jgi:hypothetical protein